MSPQLSSSGSGSGSGKSPGLWKENEEIPAFGESMRREFHLDFEHSTFCNPASYGVCPKRVLEDRLSVITESERNPDDWSRLHLAPSYFRSLSTVAAFVGANPDNLAFVANATTGVNTVMKSLNFGPEDQILETSQTYLATQNTVADVSKKLNSDSLCVDLNLPIESEEEIVDLFVQTCTRNRSIRLAVLDHISSSSAILFPVKKIAAALHKLDVLVMVDGAHAPGQVKDLNIEDLGVDFYVGNLHKWGYAARGCALLWVQPAYRETIAPLVTSNTYGKGPALEFQYQGTLDYSTYISAEAAVSFYQSIGGHDKIAGHVTPLLEEARTMMMEAFGTEALPVPKSMEAPFMKVLALPSAPHLGTPTFDLAERLIIDIHEESGVWAQIVCISGRLWLRLSGNIFSVMEDYEKLKKAIMQKFQLCEK